MITDEIHKLKLEQIIASRPPEHPLVKILQAVLDNLNSK